MCSHYERNFCMTTTISSYTLPSLATLVCQSVYVELNLFNKQNKTKRNETKRNETKRNETKRNETKRNRTEPNRTEPTQPKQNKTKILY